MLIYKDKILSEPGNVDFGSSDISRIGDGTVTGSIVFFNSKVKSFGIVEVNIGGVAINTKDSNSSWYYAHVDIADKLPSGAMPFAVTFASYDTNVFVDVLYERKIVALRSPNSHTMYTGRKVYVHYYI